MAFKKAYESDKNSSFGGVIILNRKINLNLAKIISNLFIEAIVAPNFDKSSINFFKKKKKNLILINIKNVKKPKYEIKKTIFGDLYQTINNGFIDANFLKLVSLKKTSKINMEDLIFALKVVKHLKSNAIVLVKNKQTIGVGVGQTNRFEALRIALDKKKNNFSNIDFVCSSDGFFPFTDGLKLLKKNNCKVVAQPSGSKNDLINIKYANKNKISLYFTKNRLFKH